MGRKRIHILVLTALLVCCICIIPAHAASGEPDQSPGIIDPAAVIPGITPPLIEGDSFDNPIILSDGSTLSVTISSAQSYRYLKFVPSASGIYTIESYNSTCDPAVWLYDAEYNQLGYNDNIGNDVNFRMALILQQGETYYFVVDAPYQITGTYHVRFSATSSNALTSTATDTNYSVYINQNRCFSFTPEVSTEYLFYSFNDTGNPELTIYDEDFDLVTCNSTDMGLNYNFRITANLTAGETYYLAAHAYPGQTASYDFCILMVPTTLNETTRIRNCGSFFYIKIQDLDTPLWLIQYSYSTGTQALWTIVKQNDGYYTIQSNYGNQYYIGISSIAIGSGIRLYSSISDNTRWKIYVNSNGELFFEPKNAPGRVLSASNNSNNSELVLKWMNDSLDKRNIWKLESQSPAVPEMQQKSLWCWVASAKMFAHHYFYLDNPNLLFDSHTQEEIVNEIRQNTYDLGGHPEDAIQAINLYLGIGEIDEPLGLRGYIDQRLSQASLKQHLNDGHVVWIGRHPYENGKQSEGHATVIVGYTTEFIQGAIQYYYIILDPDPQLNSEEETDSEDDTDTEGDTNAEDDTDSEPEINWDHLENYTAQMYNRSYQWICNGLKGLPEEDEDDKIWDWIVVVDPDQALNTLSPYFN